MVPRSESPSNGPVPESEATDPSQGELNLIIRKSVEDAILGDIGTILLVGLAIVLIWFGVMVTISAYGSSMAGALGGIFVVLFGFYIAASSLGVIPSIGNVV